MNARVLLTSFVLAAAPASFALAHPDGKPHQHKHAPAIDEAAARERAQAEVERLIGAGKLEASWKGVACKSLEKKPIKKRWEWLATFENPAAGKDKLLYVFLKPSGEFVAANHTGK